MVWISRLKRTIRALSNQRVYTDLLEARCLGAFAPGAKPPDLSQLPAEHPVRAFQELLQQMDRATSPVTKQKQHTYSRSR